MRYVVDRSSDIKPMFKSSMVIRSKGDQSNISNSTYDDAINKSGRSTVPVARVRKVSVRVVRILAVRLSIAVMR